MKYNEPQLRLPVRPIISICCSFKKVPCCLVFIVNDSPLSRFCAFYKSHFFPTVWKVLKEDVNWAWLQFGRFSVSTVIFNLFFWFKSRTMCPSVNLDPLLNLFGVLRPIRNIISCIKNGCNPVIFNTNMKKIVMCFHAQIDSMWLLGGWVLPASGWFFSQSWGSQSCWETCRSSQDVFQPTQERCTAGRKVQRTPVTFSRGSVILRVCVDWYEESICDTGPGIILVVSWACGGLLEV